jgi:hypothetical protein
VVEQKRGEEAMTKEMNKGKKVKQVKLLLHHPHTCYSQETIAPQKLISS